MGEFGLILRIRDVAELNALAHEHRKRPGFRLVHIDLHLVLHCHVNLNGVHEACRLKLHDILHA